MKNRNFWMLAIGIFLSCCTVFLNCGVTDAGEPPVVGNELPLFEQKIIENGEKLIELRGERFAINPDVDNLFYLISNERQSPNIRRRSLVSALWSIGTTGASGFINEPLVIELLIYALADSERDVRRDAFDILTRNTEWRLLPPFKFAIRGAIANNDGGPLDSVQIFCLLNPTASEKQLWLASARTLAQRAALGDVRSEDSLIAQFEDISILPENSTDFRLSINTFRRFENLAFDLAFVGFNSQRSRIALVNGLETDIYVKRVPDEVMSESGIFPVIRELNRIHPGEPLLSSEFRNFRIPIYTATGIIDDPDTKDYLNRLARWAESTYGITLDLPKETSFIRIMSDPLGGRTRW